MAALGLRLEHTGAGIHLRIRGEWGGEAAVVGKGTGHS
jgi:hypothetical protein